MEELRIVNIPHTDNPHIVILTSMFEIRITNPLYDKYCGLFFGDEKTDNTIQYDELIIALTDTDAELWVREVAITHLGMSTTEYDDKRTAIKILDLTTLTDDDTLRAKPLHMFVWCVGMLYFINLAITSPDHVIGGISGAIVLFTARQWFMIDKIQDK